MRNKYSFLLEAVQQNNPRSIQQKRISINSALKPLPIGSISALVNAEVNVLKNKIMYQLSRLNQLGIHLNQQVNDPRYIKVRQRNMVDLQMLKQCEIVHKNYFNKVLYYRNKTNYPDMEYLNTINRQYTAQLFQLNQQYQRIKLQMKGVNPNAY